MERKTDGLRTHSSERERERSNERETEEKQKTKTEMGRKLTERESKKGRKRCVIQ